jgi:D-methionine transport system substrate-binding protein
MSAGDAARFGPRPGRDSIGVEDARSPCQHLPAVRFRDANAGWVARLVRAYQPVDVARLIPTW